jgi:hypothetical protein
MKGTVVEVSIACTLCRCIIVSHSLLQGTISNLFEGKMESYIKCCHVEYVSSRVETFFDIQLNIKDKKDGILQCCTQDGASLCPNHIQASPKLS